MAYCFRFRTTRAISTWPQKGSKPHSSAATAGRSSKNQQKTRVFFLAIQIIFCVTRAPFVPARPVSGVRATLVLSSYVLYAGNYLTDDAWHFGLDKISTRPKRPMDEFGIKWKIKNSRMQIFVFEVAPRLLVAVISHESFWESKNRTSQLASA